MNKIWRIKAVARLGVMAVALWGASSEVWAAPMGVCSNCHVMHASQLGQLGVTYTPQDFLLKTGCLGCHTGTNAVGLGTVAGTIPYVLDTVAPVYGGASNNSLAGGNFWYSNSSAQSGAQSERYGHNPTELGAVDSKLTAPPGWKATGFAANDQVGTIDATHPLSCAGTYGCHGNHDATGIQKAHHTNTTGVANATAGVLGTSYRFLKNIQGYEADDYELQPTTAASHHNVYFGAQRNVNNDLSNNHTISYLCAECHGIFHTGQAVNEGLKPNPTDALGSPWIRHPVDFEMSNAAGYEEAAYVYTPNVPVGTYVAPTAGANLADPTVGRIVMCVTCHRAHASPYPEALRWDMTTMIAGGSPGNTNGCFACHTTKN